MCQDFENLMDMYKSKDPVQREYCIRRSSKLPSAERIKLLKIALKDRSSYVLATVAAVLKTDPLEELETEMIDLFQRCSEDGKKHDPGCSIRSHLAIAFGKLKSTSAVELLKKGSRTFQVESILDSAGQLRGNCCLALADIASSDGFFDIVNALFDDSPPNSSVQFDIRSRIAAIHALIRTGRVDAKAPIWIKLKIRDNPSVLQECMHALVEMGDPNAFEAMYPYLHDRDSALVAAASIQLIRLDRKDAIVLVLEQLETLPDELIQAVVIALAGERTDLAQTTLLQLQQSENKKIVEYVSDTLGCS